MIEDFLTFTLAQQIPPQCEGTASGFTWKWLAHGVVLLEPNQPLDSCDHIAISAGIHGNETAPIELLEGLLQDLSRGVLTLNVRLLVLLGHPSAMQTGERYQQIDLNRLFSGQHRHYEASIETQRAAQLESLTHAFFSASTQGNQSSGKKWHLDLHTAIRGSHHVRFAVLPFQESQSFSRSLFCWLDSAGIEAAVLNQAPSGTFSYFTSHYCGADSCTLELGKAKPFGDNDLSQFAQVDLALRHLIEQGIQDVSPTKKPPILVYKVTQQLTKLTENFTLNFPDSVKNFTTFHQGEVLATDGDTTYTVAQAQEWVLFPNAKVRPGLRAGLMLIRTDVELE